MPVRMPSRSQTAANTSLRVLPAPAPKPRVDPSICTAPGPDGEDRVGDARSRGCRGRGSRPAHRRRPRPPRPRPAIADVVEDHRARRVDHVRALATGVDHDPGLLGERLGRHLVGHHQEADGLEARARGRARSAGSEMSASVQCVAMRTIDTPRSRHAAHVVHRADAGHHERGDLGLLGGLDGGLHQHPLVGRASGRS